MRTFVASRYMRLVIRTCSSLAEISSWVMRKASTQIVRAFNPRLLNAFQRFWPTDISMLFIITGRGRSEVPRRHTIRSFALPSWTIRSRIHFSRRVWYRTGLVSGDEAGADSGSDSTTSDLASNVKRPRQSRGYPLQSE